MNRAILIVACLLVAGGVGAWAAGVFESEKADASAGKNRPAVHEAGGALAVDKDSCGGCPVMGGGSGMGGGLSVVNPGGGCPASSDATEAAAGEAPAAMALPCEGCGAATEKAACTDCADCPEKGACGGGGCGDKGSCGGGGCGEKGSCGDQPKSGCGGCDEEKSGDGQ